MDYSSPYLVRPGPAAHKMRSLLTGAASRIGNRGGHLRRCPSAVGPAARAAAQRLVTARLASRPEGAPVTASAPAATPLKVAHSGRRAASGIIFRSSRSVSPNVDGSIQAIYGPRNGSALPGVSPDYFESIADASGRGAFTHDDVRAPPRSAPSGRPVRESRSSVRNLQSHGDSHRLDAVQGRAVMQPRGALHLRPGPGQTIILPNTRAEEAEGLGLWLG